MIFDFGIHSTRKHALMCHTKTPFTWHKLLKIFLNQLYLLEIDWKKYEKQLVFCYNVLAHMF